MAEHTFTPDFFNTKFRKVTEQLSNQVIMNDDSITWHNEFYADFKQEDEGMPQLNELYSQTLIYKREQITGVKKFWYYTDKVWGVLVNCKGAYDEMNVCWKKEEDAEIFFKAVWSWAFKK